MANSIYPNLTKEEVANLTQEEKDMYLYKWLMAKPTKENIVLIGTILPTLPNEFWDFLLEGILESMAMDNEEPTRERIKEDVETMVESWMTFPNDFYEYYGYFLDDCKEKGIKIESNKAIALN